MSNDSRNSILVTCYYQDLGSASDWMKQISLSCDTTNQKHYPDTQVVTGHQYGISAGVTQTSHFTDTHLIHTPH